MTLLSLQVGDHEGYTDLDSQRRSERNYKFSFDDKALDENPVPKPDPEPDPEAEAATSGRSCAAGNRLRWERTAGSATPSDAISGPFQVS